MFKSTYMLVFNMSFGPVCWHLIWYYNLLPLTCDIILLCNIKFCLHGLFAKVLLIFSKLCIKTANLLI